MKLGNKNELPEMPGNPWQSEKGKRKNPSNNNNNNNNK